MPDAVSAGYVKRFSMLSFGCFMIHLDFLEATGFVLRYALRVVHADIGLDWRGP